MAADRLPGHLAIIMDGNGRWAQARGLDRTEGHRHGAGRVREVVTRCRELGIRSLTLYAFSSENWGRPRDEVRTLMRLLASYLERQVSELCDRGIELAAIGDLGRLPAPVRRLLTRAIELTRGLAGMRLTLALSYGGRDELVRAVRRVVGDVASGSLATDSIDAAALEERLDTAGIPHPDLIIRTGGESRLSNFLLWQAAYAELYFTNRPWPDFGAQDLERALAWYRGRSRRFGLV
jgi:undecaprenyl diphosphate synthase